MQTRRALLAASLLVIVGCSSDKSTSPGSATGAVSFTYTGGGGGTFNVSGTIPTIAANVGNNDWGAGFRDTPNTAIEIAAGRTRGSGRYDLVIVSLTRLTVGTSSVSANCDPEAAVCSGMALLINISEADQNFNFFCTLATGSLAITSISSDRVQGTFTGSGACFSGTGATSAFTVTGGTFDVPLVTNLPV